MAKNLPKVFITGASGYIGNEVALTYRRAGYIVYGHVRSEQKAKELAVGEILPVIGDLTDPEGKWIDVMKQCKIVIYCAADYKNYDTVDFSTVKIILSALSSVGTPSDPVRFVYTSGVLVHKGLQWPQDAPHTDDSPTDDDGPDVLKARLKLERLALSAYEETKGTVAGFLIRAPYVYGKKSKNFYMYFEQALKGDVVIQGDPNIYSSNVHIDDLCEAYMKLTSHPFEQIHSRPFNICVPGQYYSVQQVAEHFSRIAGYTGPIRLEPVSEFWKPYQKSVVCNPVNAQKLLGWAPRHLPMLDKEELEALFAGWKASNNVGTWN